MSTGEPRKERKEERKKGRKEERKKRKKGRKEERKKGRKEERKKGRKKRKEERKKERSIPTYLLACRYVPGIGIGLAFNEWLSDVGRTTTNTEIENKSLVTARASILVNPPSYGTLMLELLLFYSSVDLRLGDAPRSVRCDVPFKRGALTTNHMRSPTYTQTP